jgi:hypothetical protein
MLEELPLDVRRRLKFDALSAVIEIGQTNNLTGVYPYSNWQRIKRVNLSSYKA